jgi:hypothetical protein
MFDMVVYSIRRRRETNYVRIIFLQHPHTHTQQQRHLVPAKKQNQVRIIHVIYTTPSPLQIVIIKMPADKNKFPYIPIPSPTCPAYICIYPHSLTHLKTITLLKI